MNLQTTSSKPSPPKHSKPQTHITPQDAARELLRRRKARRGLIGFTEYTKGDYKVAAHHTLVASYLEKVEAGEIDRLMIFLPPRHGKSELSSRRFPAWYLGRNPNKQIIAASYNSDLAADFGRDVRNLVADPLYANLFDVGLRQDSKAADRWNTTQGGAYVAAGVGSGITGRGAHIGIIDDPFKDRKEADSETVRDNVWNWYTSTFYTRLMPGAAIVLMQTRWHEDDLAGRLLNAQKAGGDQWTIVNLPAVAEGQDELGRQDGEALWPEWYDEDGLARIKNAIGTYDWEALYQQRPVAQSGNIFKREWWHYYKTPDKYSLVIQSWDTAHKVDEENDFSVCTTWGISGNMIDLIDRFKAKLEFPELKRAAVTLGLRFQAEAILIEDKSSGQSLIQELRQETGLPVLPVKVDRDKVSRAHAVTPLIEGGRVRLPEWASWVDDYISVMAAFPKGANDDDVDSTTQALNYLRDRISYEEVVDDGHEWELYNRRGRSEIGGY